MATKRLKKRWTPTRLLPAEAPARQNPAAQGEQVSLQARGAATLSIGLRILVSELGRWLLSRVLRRRERSLHLARRLRAFAERIGGMWVILVRLISLRTDLLGNEFCWELSRTRDEITPIPFPLIREAVTQELRGLSILLSFEDVFSEFDETPLVARWYSQLHRARLKHSGREVVVRIQPPDASERAKTDWRYMKLVCSLLTRFAKAPYLNWDGLFFEVKKFTDDQLDFRTEVSELRHLRKVLAPSRIYVPRVYRRLCSERMMTAEYIEGVSVSQLRQVKRSDPGRYQAWLQENRISPKKVWNRLFLAHQELLFEHNLFFAELFPSSVLLLRGNRIALFNRSVIATLDADLKKGYQKFYRALIDSDYTKVADYYLMMGPPIPHKDVSEMRMAAQRALRRWESRTHIRKCPFDEKSLAGALEQLARCATEQELPTTWNLARLQLGERTFNLALEILDPTRDTLNAMRRYERSAQLRAIQRFTKKVSRRQVDQGADTAQLSAQLLENLEHDGEYLRERLLGRSGYIGRAASIARSLLLLGGKLLVLGLLIQVYVRLRPIYDVSGPTAGQRAWGRMVTALGTHSLATWVLAAAGLYLVWSFLRKLARQLS